MPMVIRMPFAGGYGGAEHHNDSPETYYAHTSGLKVVIPSTPLDAYGLLRASVDDPDPVVFLEPKSRYWSKETGDLAATGEPIGRARVVRQGGSVTIVAYGAMVSKSLTAAVRLAEEGIECRVLDLRSLVPLDVEALGAAVRDTGRAVVVHEAPLTLGFGAEVAARIMEEAFDHLEAPVARVAGYDIPYPPATLEQHYVPSAERIARAVRRTVEY
jgi:pyruvate dehydrogenase E1 component beta subunit